MGRLDHQIVAMLQHFLDDALEGAVVPQHLDLALQPSGAIGLQYLVQPLPALGNDAVAHLFPLIHGQHGGHLVREVVNRQEQGQLGALVQLGDLDRAFERDLALLFRVDHHQNVSVLDHVLLLGKNANDGNSLAITA